MGDGNSCLESVVMLILLPKRRSKLMLVQEVDSEVFLDISQMHKNMAENNINNNREVWSDKETEVLLDLIQRT